MFTTLTQEWGFTATLQQQKVSKNMGLRGLNYSHSIELCSRTLVGKAFKKSLYHFFEKNVFANLSSKLNLS